MKTRFLIPLAILAVSAGCATYRIVPPAIDLTALGTLGVVTFKVQNAKGDLDTTVTRSFRREVTAAQHVPVVELGLPGVVLAEVGKSSFDREAFLAIGKERKVTALFLGEIQVRGRKQQVAVSDAWAAMGETRPALSPLEITVNVRLVSTANGATLWTGSFTREILFIAVRGEHGVPVFVMQEERPQTVASLRQIAFRLASDFRPTRQRS